MKAFVIGILLAFFFSGAPVFAGGYLPQQQVAPEPKILVIPPSEKEKRENILVPIAVAIVGAAGLIGAAYVSRRKGN